MPAIPLLPHMDADPTRKPGFADFLDDGRPLPREWEVRDLPPLLEAGQRDPATAFPDPFFRKEALADAIRRGRGEYLNHWKFMVGALAAGLFRVQPVDLATYGAFGRCVTALHPERRMLSLVYAHLGNGWRLVGLTDPDVLLWPAARRTRQEWTELKGQARKLATERNPMDLLADLRGGMRRQRLWAPDRVLWMRALDLMLRGRAASEGLVHLQEHSRGVGPFLLSLPHDDKLALQPVYFPVMEPGWAGQVRQLATMRFSRDADGHLLGRDAKGIAQVRIRLPRGLNERERRLMGLGLVDRLTDHPPDWGDTVTLAHEDGLFQSLGSDLYPPQRLDPLRIRQQPWRHPDPIRVLVGAVGSAGLPDHALGPDAGARNFTSGGMAGAIPRSGSPSMAKAETALGRP